MISTIHDPLNRKFKKLRVSLTNDCNLSCTYCVPGVPFSLDRRHETSLSTRVRNVSKTSLNWKELANLIVCLNTQCKFDEIKLTGGEPLLNPHLPELVTFLKKNGMECISLTTNGVYLSSYLNKLSGVGLKKINVSLDAINPLVFKKITGHDQGKRVIENIKMAVQKGFDVKLNSVVLKGINSAEIIPLLEFAQALEIKIRFLEVMKMGYLKVNGEQHFFSADEILKEIEKKYLIRPLPRTNSSTAEYWGIGDQFQFGIIANESLPFCHDCNRLRIDQYGEIYGCLSTNEGISITDTLNNKLLLTSKLQEAMRHKQLNKFVGSTLSMMQIGG